MAKKASRGRSKGHKKSEKKGARWPQERQILQRPDRMKYVRKMIPIKGCVFCASRDEGVKPESLCLYKNDLAMVVLNKFPYNSGHVMVLPVRHCGDLTELSEREFLAVQDLLRRTVEIVKKIYRVDGLNIGLNMGAVAGAGLPDHLHWHVIPRWFGDTNFFPLVAETKVLPETTEQTYQRYAEYFRGQNAKSK